MKTIYGKFNLGTFSIEMSAGIPSGAVHQVVSRSLETRLRSELWHLEVVNIEMVNEVMRMENKVRRNLEACAEREKSILGSICSSTLP